jgi:hypothetical protein
MSRALLLSSLLFLGVGCAGASNGLRAEGAGIRMGQQSAEPMVVTNRYITGPSSSLVLHEEGMRGRFRDRPVDLRWDYQKVTGVFGAQPTLLELSEGDDTRASGSFGGAPVDLLVKENVMVARVGICAYYMTRVEGGYSGRRDCAGPLRLHGPLHRPAGAPPAHAGLLVQEDAVGEHRPGSPPGAYPPRSASPLREAERS